VNNIRHEQRSSVPDEKNKIDVIIWKTKTWKKLDVTENNKVTEYSADHIIIATGARRELPTYHKMVKKLP
jgi:pyruvate/2-oxoglutarate dehydrogenase complex dihydrolipoamide dehydrogenase (E3) component